MKSLIAQLLLILIIQGNGFAQSDAGLPGENYSCSGWTNEGYYWVYCPGQSAQVKEILEEWNAFIIPGEVDWENDFRRLFTYNSSGQPIEIEYQFYEDDRGWEPVYKYLTTYTSDGYQTELIYQTWINNSWQNETLSATSYNKSGRRTSLLSQIWDSTGAAWVNNYKSNNQYNAEGGFTESITKVWGGADWENSYRYKRTYDGSHIEDLGQSWENGEWVNQSKVIIESDDSKNISEIISQVWENKGWVNQNKTILGYDDSDRFIQNIHQIWAGEWVNKYKTDYTFDAPGDLVRVEKQDWEEGAWVNDERYIHTYFDMAGNRSETLEQQGDGNDWANSIQTIYNYDESGNLAGFLKQFWFDSTWEAGSRVTFFYEQPTHVAGRNLVPQDFSISNYPNPFNPTTQIRYALPADAKVDITIFNVFGQKIKTLLSKKQKAGTHHISWNGLDRAGMRISSGIYYYRVIAGRQNLTGKMTLLK